MRSATHPSCDSSRGARGAAPASTTCRSTSTCCSASRRWRCAGRGGTTWSRSRRRRRTSAGALGLPPRLPRQRAPAGLRLPALAAAPRRRADADGVCARGDRPGSPGRARAPVLALLRLQRLEQLARGRLGDDPARLRRADGRGRLSIRHRSRSGTASTRAPSGPPGTTRSSSASTARTRSSTRPTARTRTSTGRRCISAAPRRRASAATTRAGRPSTCGRRS